LEEETKRGDEKGKWMNRAYSRVWVLVLTVFLWGGVWQGNALSQSDELPCDFEVEIAEPDFCVIRGMVYDIDVALIPVEGACTGSVALHVEGFPAGITQKLASSSLGFTSQTFSTTVRIDTAKMTLKERHSYPLIFSASQKGVTRTTEATMTVDLPDFDFSIRSNPAQLQVTQGASASADVEVTLTGAACAEPPVVVLSLAPPSSPLSLNVTHEFASDTLVPSDKAKITFQAASAPELGSFNATLVGCCTDAGDERTAEINLQIVPSAPVSPDAPVKKEEGARKEVAPSYENLVEEGEKVRVDKLDKIMTDLQLPQAVQEEAKKNVDEDANRGYRKASEEEVDILKPYKSTALPMDMVIGTLSFEPATLTATPFDELSLDGAYATGRHVNGKWTAVVRVFTIQDEATLTLSEDHLPTSGGSENVIAEEGVELHINDFPTTLVVKQSESGKAISSLSWQTKTRAYTLRTTGNVKANGKKEWFLGLAQSIPKE
jgi:hypothetical protein